MKLLEEAGVLRLQSFIKELSNLEQFSSTEPGFDRLISVIASMKTLAQGFIEYNDLSYWILERNVSVFFSLYRKIDHDSGTYAPGIFLNEQLIPVFEVYQKLLIDLKSNWTSYIPFMTRVDLNQFNLEQQIANIIEIMAIQREWYDRQRNAIEPQKLGEELRNNMSDLIEKIEQAIDEDRLNINEFSRDFSTLHEKILKLPIAFRDRSLAYKCHSRAEFFGELITCEIKLNKYLLSKQCEPLFTNESEAMERQLDHQKIKEFNGLLDKIFHELEADLLEYILHGEESKKMVAHNLLSSIKKLEKNPITEAKNDTTGKWYGARYFIEEARLQHLKLLLQTTMEPGMLGTILVSAHNKIFQLRPEVVVNSDGLLANTALASFAATENPTMTKKINSK